MKLRKFEIEAVVDEIYSTLKNNEKLPAFKEEIKQLEKFNSKIEDLEKKKEAISKERRDYLTKILGYTTYISNPERILNQLQNLASTIPNKKSLEREVILNSDKELNEIVRIILAKYN